MLKLWVYLLGILLSGQTMAGLALKLEMIHKKGIDKGLILTSELHSVEEIAGREVFELSMANGPKAKVKVDLSQAPEDYGPSDLVALYIKVTSRSNRPIGESQNNKKMFVRFGEKHIVSYRDKEGDQLLEIKVTPFMQ